MDSATLTEKLISMCEQLVPLLHEKVPMIQTTKTAVWFVSASVVPFETGITKGDERLLHYLRKTQAFIEEEFDETFHRTHFFLPDWTSP